MDTTCPDRWVLLRGLMREAGHWGDWPARLARTLPQGSEVLMHDLPGNGARFQERSPVRVHDMVTDLRQGLPPARPGQRTHVVALSLGGMVAMEWARQAPQEVHSLTLVNTSVRPFSPFWHRLRPARWPDVLRLTLLERGPEAREARLMAMTTRQPDRPEATLRHWVALHRRHPVGTLNAWRQLLAASRYRAPDGAPLDGSVLLVCSRGDGLVNPACTEALGRHWKLPVQVHPSAGHDLPLDDGDWLIERHLRWLQAQFPHEV